MLRAVLYSSVEISHYKLKEYDTSRFSGVASMYQNLDSRMVISPEFKEEIPSIQSLQSISESYPKSDLLSKSA
jgi:hypothetical protein